MSLSIRPSTCHPIVCTSVRLSICTKHYLGNVNILAAIRDRRQNLFILHTIYLVCRTALKNTSDICMIKKSIYSANILNTYKNIYIIQTTTLPKLLRPFSSTSKLLAVHLQGLDCVYFQPYQLLKQFFSFVFLCSQRCCHFIFFLLKNKFLFYRFIQWFH